MFKITARKYSLKTMIPEQEVFTSIAVKVELQHTTLVQTFEDRVAVKIVHLTTNSTTEIFMLLPSHLLLPSHVILYSQAVTDWTLQFHTL